MMFLAHLASTRLLRCVHAAANLKSFVPQIIRCLSTDEVKSASSIQRAPGDGGVQHGRHTKNKTERSAWPVYSNDVTVNVEFDEDINASMRVLDGYSFYRFKDGTTYAGMWKEGVFHGQGKKISRNGNVYAGFWAHGKKHGKGKLYWKDKRYAKDNCYTGYWKENKEHGGGKQVFGNGDCFDGWFFEGQRSGRGKLTYANGDTLEGVFRNNEIFAGKGVAVAQNGTKRIGSFQDGALHGPGKIVFRDGRTIEGEFVAGKLVE